MIWFIRRHRKAKQQSIAMLPPFPSSDYNDAQTFSEKSSSKILPTPYLSTSPYASTIEPRQAEASGGAAINELGATTRPSEVAGIPLIELDGTPILEQYQPRDPPPTPRFVYTPYRPAEEDGAQPTQYAGVQFPSTYTPMPDRESWVR
jgi:hypothetical protein